MTTSPEFPQPHDQTDDEVRKAMGAAAGQGDAPSPDFIYNTPTVGEHVAKLDAAKQAAVPDIQNMSSDEIWAALEQQR